MQGFLSAVLYEFFKFDIQEFCSFIHRDDDVDDKDRTVDQREAEALENHKDLKERFEKDKEGDKLRNTILDINSTVCNLYSIR